MSSNWYSAAQLRELIGPAPCTSRQANQMLVAAGHMPLSDDKYTDGPRKQGTWTQSLVIRFLQTGTCCHCDGAMTITDSKSTVIEHCAECEKIGIPGSCGKNHTSGSGDGLSHETCNQVEKDIRKAHNSGRTYEELLTILNAEYGRD